MRGWGGGRWSLRGYWFYVGFWRSGWRGGGIDVLFGVRLGARGVLGGSVFEAPLKHRLERAVEVLTGAMAEYLYGSLDVVVVGIRDNGCDVGCSELNISQCPQ